MLRNVNMITKETLDEIMTLPKGESVSMSHSLRMGLLHAPIAIKLDEETFENYYEINLNTLLNSDITNEELVEMVTIGEWVYSTDETKLIRKITD